MMRGWRAAKMVMILWPAPCLAVPGLVIMTPPAHADMAFHISEDVVEDEVSPRHAHYVTHWEGDYYVTDRDVTATGWARKPAEVRTVPSDHPTEVVNPWGSRVVTTYRKTSDGIDVTLDYDTFVVTRHVATTGPGSCTVTTTTALKPGETAYVVHRRTNHEQMFDIRRDIVNAKCRPPQLVG